MNNPKSPPITDCTENNTHLFVFVCMLNTFLSYRSNKWFSFTYSDLPDDNKSVLLVGVTKIPSPTLTSRNRPHTVHLDHHVALNRNSQPCRTLSDDSIYEANNENPKSVSRRTFDFERCKNKLKFIDHSPLFDKLRPKSKTKDKRVSFGTSDSQKLGFCKELPFEYYHPNRNGVERGMMDKSVDSIGSCSLDVDASSTDFSGRRGVVAVVVVHVAYLTGSTSHVIYRKTSRSRNRRFGSNFANTEQNSFSLPLSCHTWNDTCNISIYMFLCNL